MANYMCAIRSNYFSVNDPEAFLTFIGRVYGSEEDLQVWEDNGKYAFGCYGAISGLRRADDEVCSEDGAEDEDTYDAFISGLQQFLSEGEAILIAESGWEKLRYLVGRVEIITKTDFKQIDMYDAAVDAAGDMLGYSLWSTRYSY